MYNRRFLTYAVNKEDGFVMSRCNDELAHPVLEFEKIGQNGDFTGPLTYHLEKFPLVGSNCRGPEWKWTKKIPIELKNRHRAFWGMKPLPRKATKWSS